MCVIAMLHVIYSNMNFKNIYLHAILIKIEAVNLKEWEVYVGEFGVQRKEKD